MKTNEQKLKEILSKVNGETVIGQCILTAIESGKPPFDQLVSELKDQMGDCGRERMIEIVGIDAVKLLEVL